MAVVAGVVAVEVGVRVNIGGRGGIVGEVEVGVVAATGVRVGWRVAVG